MEKLDFRKTLKHLYSATASPVLVDVPEMTYLMVDGEGDPNLSQGFQEAMGVLYGVAYTLKFVMKKRARDPYDFAVMMPEGLWWSPSGANPYEESKANWRWTLMLAVPPTITEEEFGEACRQLRERKNPPGLDRIRFERFREGLCAQVMHVGPYADEPKTIEKLHAFIAHEGRTTRGKHHEIYLNDPNRTAPEKLRTIIRQPVT